MLLCKHEMVIIVNCEKTHMRFHTLYSQINICVTCNCISSVPILDSHICHVKSKLKHIRVKPLTRLNNNRTLYMQDAFASVLNHSIYTRNLRFF